MVRHILTRTIGALVLSGSALVPVVAATPAGAAARPHQTDQQLLALETNDVRSAATHVAATLPTRLGAPAPSTPANLFRSPLRAHQVLGFIGGAGFGGVTQTELADVSTLVTNALEIGANGTLVESGPGWNDLHDPDFPPFVTTAHAAGDRVLLDVSSEALPTIARVLRAPATDGASLGTEVGQTLVADHLDGVDLDVEGRVGGQRAHYVSYVTAFVRSLRATDPPATVVLNTFAQSASDKTGFFDVATLARRVDDLFVMAYDMTEGGFASPNAPLASPVLGLSDVQSLIEYTKVVPAAKLLLSVPFYGYDFPTVSKTPGARTTGPAESVTVGNVVAVGRKPLWDPGSSTPFYAFTRAGKWHQTWFEDPASIALKTALAAQFHLAGVGAWSLGQEGDATSVLAALDGGSSPVRGSVAS